MMSCDLLVADSQTGPTYSLWRTGVIQMNGGILLSFFNQRYFRDQLSIYCEFIPQVIFLNGLFGYLCILIVSKWITGSTADLYHVMIYMFLSPGTGGLACLDATGKYGCKENIMFPGQGPLQVLSCRAVPALVHVHIISLPAEAFKMMECQEASR